MTTKTEEEERARWSVTLEPDSYAGFTEPTLIEGASSSESLLPAAPALLSPGGHIVACATSLWHTTELFEEVLFVLHDPVTLRTGAAIIDVVDSRARPELARQEPMRCADLAMRALLEALSGGSRPSRWIATLVGGSCAPGADPLFHLGLRLESMLMRLLDRHSILDRRFDLGGSIRRTCTMNDGLLRIRKGAKGGEIVVSCVRG